MRKTRMMIVFAAVVVVMAAVLSASAGAKEKRIKCSCTVYAGGTKKWSDPAVVAAKKLKIACQCKRIVSVKKRGGNLLISGKRKGKAKVNVTAVSRKGKKYRFLIRISIKDKKKALLKKGKTAFAIQNRYREEKGMPSLKWSDELYRFAQYRLKTSGYDQHKNMDRDREDYFGSFASDNELFISENLYIGSSYPEMAMKSWKKSEGHYKNLLSREYVIGAIAEKNGVWCSVFMDTTFEEMRTNEKVKIRVKRYDAATDSFVAGSRLVYYEADSAEEDGNVAEIRKPEGKVLLLEAGKTYIFAEKISPGGCGMAEPKTVRISRDGSTEIILGI